MLLSSKTVQFVLHVIIPVICSIIIGFMLCGVEIFDQHSITSVFIQTPIIASVFYFLLTLGKPKGTYVGLFVLLVLTFIVDHPTTSVFIFRQLIYFIEIVIAVFLYFKYFRQRANTNYFYTAVTLSGLYATICLTISQVHVSAFKLLGLDDGRITAWTLATHSAFFGAAIGFAVGGGFTIADKLLGDMSSRTT